MSEDVVEQGADSQQPDVVYIAGANITVRDLALAINKSPIDLLKILMQYGLMVPVTQFIDIETAQLVGEELGVVIKPQSEQVEETTDVAADGESDHIGTAELGRIQTIVRAENVTALQARPLVVTVLGHVDHGKTTLLDTIRKTNIVDTEAGGITQSIGAYQVEHISDDHAQTITFIDTPGHHAFTQMRARGAGVTDLAILVVAADDGIMPQTEEAIDHARAAQVPILVALNKIDRPNANPDHVLTQLANLDLTPSDWGGDTHVVPISALQGDNIEELLDTITLLTDEISPQANPQGRTLGTVLEAHVDSRSGVTATVLVQNGSLRQGDHVVIGRSWGPVPDGDQGVLGQTWGRIKAMHAYNGKRIREVGPGTPVQILGITDPPAAGDLLEQVASKKVATQRVETALREQTDAAKAEMVIPQSLEELFATFQKEESEKLLQLIVRADVQGSLEPIQSSLLNLDQNEIRIEFLRTAVGDISESDVLLVEASHSPTVILGFNVAVERTAAIRAQNSNVDIRLYSIIYELLQDMEQAMSGMLDPSFEEIVIGQAEVRQQFPVRGGVVAGCVVIDGVVKQDAQVRLVRPGSPETLSRIVELRRFRDQVDMVRMGQDCGIRLLDVNDFADGDLIEVLEQQEQVRSL